MIKKTYLIINDFSKQLRGDNIAAYASSTAFFFFLSFVPILLIISSIITFTPLTEEFLANELVHFVPAHMQLQILNFTSQIYAEATTILPIAIVVALWSAGKGVMGLQMGLNVANGVKEDRNFLIIRLQASFYTLVMMLAIVITFAFSMLGETCVGIITNYAPQLKNVFDFFSDYRFVFGWAVLTILFSLIYKFIPNKKLKLKYEIPGAALAAICWQICSWGFSLYVDTFNGMSTYGSLSTIIVVLMWLYASMYILLIGANLNKYFKPIIKVFDHHMKGKVDV